MEEVDSASRQPQVGILWLVNGTLLIERTPLDLAEQVGAFRTLAMGHNEIWRSRQARNLLLREYPYDYFPRGRVTFDSEHGLFHLYLDACILGRREMVAKIMDEMQLATAGTLLDADAHYRCAGCHPGYLSFIENRRSKR